MGRKSHPISTGLLRGQVGGRGTSVCRDVGVRVAAGEHGGVRNKGDSNWDMRHSTLETPLNKPHERMREACS